jgi:phage head maturation protease
MPGFAEFISSIRPSPEERGSTLEQMLARAAQDRDREPEPEDPDDRLAAMVTRGYSPGLMSQLSQQLGDTLGELQAEQDKIARGERREALARREYEAGRINVWAMQQQLLADGDFGDEGRASRLERRAESLQSQLVQAAAMIAPQQEQVTDPLEQATRRANQVFREITRSLMAEAQAGNRPERPSAGKASRRPFGGGAGEIVRTVKLDDIRVLRRGNGGDGRTVEAYAAVFNEPAVIHDQMGDYREVIDPHAWDGRLAEARRAPGGLPAEVKCMYNHGMTRQGTPSDRWSLPVGKPLDIRPDSRGLLTVTRYSDDEVLDRIKAGELTSQSFVGGCLNSEPELRRGERYRPDGTGNLRTVRRMKLGLREYGPVLWPAYPGAEILGVRSAAEAYASGPDRDKCPGPDCPICEYGRQQ